MSPGSWYHAGCLHCYYLNFLILILNMLFIVVSYKVKNFEINPLSGEKGIKKTDREG